MYIYICGVRMSRVQGVRIGRKAQISQVVGEEVQFRNKPPNQEII